MLSTQIFVSKVATSRRQIRATIFDAAMVRLKQRTTSEIQLPYNLSCGSMALRVGLDMIATLGSQLDAKPKPRNVFPGQKVGIFQVILKWLMNRRTTIRCVACRRRRAILSKVQQTQSRD